MAEWLLECCVSRSHVAVWLLECCVSRSHVAVWLLVLCEQVTCGCMVVSHV